MSTETLTKFEIIPAIDIIGGRCVRLTRGCYDSAKAYFEDPVEVALNFQKMGFKRVHIVDLDGAKSNEPQNLAVLKGISQKTTLKIQFGGGIKSLSSADCCFEAGAYYIICGSIAAESPQILKSIVEKHGPERVIVGADVREEKISIKGWKVQTNKSIYNLISTITKIGINTIICTDISKDGVLEGPSLTLYKKITARFPNVKLIASGGVSSAEDVTNVEKTGADGVVIGKAFYENRIKCEDLALWLQNE